MKRTALVVLCSIALLGMVVGVSSCQKGNNIKPVIYLYPGDVYVSKDTALEAGTVFTVYVSASKAGVDQVLKTGQIDLSINGGPDSVLQQMTIDKQYLLQFYSYIAGDSGNKERYTFSVTQTNGQSSDTSIVISVK